MAKSRDAFRTISEVSDWIGAPAHVLRFWESRFKQIKPIKRAGGRRYYRPGDMFLLGGIRRLLHDDGLTIKGVQKVLREKGVKYVASLCVETLDQEAPEETTSPVESSIVKATPVEEFLSGPDLDVPEAPQNHSSDIRDEAATRTKTDAHLAPENLAIDEIDTGTRALRITELYSRLRSLRDRVRASMA